VRQVDAPAGCMTAACVATADVGISSLVTRECYLCTHILLHYYDRILGARRRRGGGIILQVSSAVPEDAAWDEPSVPPVLPVNSSTSCNVQRAP
jgi:hypothetical protein